MPSRPGSPMWSMCWPEQIQVNINAAAEVNPVNLLALVLLATRKHAMSESDLIRQLQLTRSLLVELPYSDRVSVTDAPAGRYHRPRSGNGLDPAYRAPRRRCAAGR